MRESSVSLFELNSSALSQVKFKIYTVHTAEQPINNRMSRCLTWSLWLFCVGKKNRRCRPLPLGLLRLLLLSVILFTAAAVVVVHASTVVELTDENWEDATKGRAIWVKFCTSSCHHCKQMHIAWERLGDEFAAANDPPNNVVIGRVNCDVEQKLCERFEILGTPTLLYGNPHDLQEYGGEKDFASLKAWAKEVLVPYCSPDNIAACSESEKQQMDIWMNQEMSLEEIDGMIESVLDREEVVQQEFQARVQELQNHHDSLLNDHTLHCAAIQRHVQLLKHVKDFVRHSSKGVVVDAVQ
jgi:Thioredoxin domain-containing protein